MVIYGITLLSFLLFSLLSAMVMMWFVPSGNTAAVIDASAVGKLPRQKDDVNASPTERFDSWFERMVYFSGANLSPIHVMLLAVVTAVALAGVAFLFLDDFLISAVVALIVWSLAMVSVFIMGQRRLRAFEDQLPAAMNLLSKAVRAGESFEQGVQLVGESSPEPLGVEFRRCGGQLEMGLPVSTAMRSLSNRVGSFDMQVFASTVAIHRQAGGNLSETLERLADVIRQRINYRRQMRSMTGAGRISAMVISLMAPLIFLYLFFFQPQYGERLWDDPLGKLMVIVAFVSQFIGVLWVKYILKSEY